MENQIIKVVEDSWKERSEAFIKQIDQATSLVSNVLTLDNQHRQGHNLQNLSKSIGEFGAGVLDISSMAQLLSEGDSKRHTEKERLDRIRTIYEKLEKIRRDYHKNPPQCRIVSLNEDVESILKDSEAHLNSMANIFSLIRLANMEVRSRYKKELHEKFFSQFNWCHLQDEEIRLCPPFVVWSDGSQVLDSFYSKLLTLLSDGKPLKILCMEAASKSNKTGEGRKLALQASAHMELLPLTFRNIYLLQTASVNSNLTAQISKGLASPRPGVFFIYGQGSDDAACKARALQALSSRAFPQVIYDPDKSARFVTRLDLSGNPDLKLIWPKHKLEYCSAEGTPEFLECEYTYADYLYQEKNQADQFSLLDETLPESKTIPLAEFLNRTPSERIGKTPYIYSVNDKKQLIKIKPSPVIMAQTADRMHLWQSLREIAGIDNPHVQIATKQIEDVLIAEKNQSIQKIQSEMEAQMVVRQKEAVTLAMKNLALRLAGLSGTTLDLQVGQIQIPQITPASKPAQETKSPEGASQKAPSIEVPAAPQGDTVWIESKLCTTCDECITINKNIFTYNKDKKAVIKDPKGGPFKDIVKAAEKCSARVIHPGKPQDPGEKDLEKWIKRAEPFQ